MPLVVGSKYSVQRLHGSTTLTIHLKCWYRLAAIPRHQSLGPTRPHLLPRVLVLPARRHSLGSALGMILRLQRRSLRHRRQLNHLHHPLPCQLDSGSCPPIPTTGLLHTLASEGDC